MKFKVTRLPIYLGFLLFTLSVLAVSIKLASTSLNTGGVSKAAQDKTQISLNFAEPDIINLSIVGKNKISGGDFSVIYDPVHVEILSSTLKGLSGYVTSGGETRTSSGIFSFSLVSPENPLSEGILATFRISKKQDKGNTKISLDVNQSKIYTEDLKTIDAEFTGIDL